MKKYLLLIAYLILSNYCFGQTNSFPASGNVGIGTTSADQKLTIKGGGIGFEHNSSDKKLYSPIDGTLEWFTHNSASQHGFAVSHQGYRMVYLNTNGSSYLNGGNLGIGTDAPQNKLDVRESSDSNTYLTIQNNTIGTIFGSGGTSIGLAGTITHHDFALYTNLTERMRVTNTGNVGIGTADTKGYKLAVAGNMIAESVKVKLQTAWPDFVFAKSYAFPSLKETETHIKEKGHLPGIPSAAEVKANGIDLGEMNAKLLQKIEELTLHLIEQNKEIKVLKKEVKLLKSK